MAHLWTCTPVCFMLPVLSCVSTVFTFVYIQTHVLKDCGSQFPQIKAQRSTRCQYIYNAAKKKKKTCVLSTSCMLSQTWGEINQSAGTTCLSWTHPEQRGRNAANTMQHLPLFAVCCARARHDLCSGWMLVKCIFEDTQCPFIQHDGLEVGSIQMPEWATQNHIQWMWFWVNWNL